MKDGWKPLCDFLGVPVPDEPFPHENAGTATAEAILKKNLVSDLSKIALPILAGLVVVVIVVVYLLTR
ncbi:MAG: hypothetical protein NT169_25890 [Chloroflexi bacterium]|nr:hypothetical protein [Chloroflexota bacterium]